MYKHLSICHPLFQLKKNSIVQFLNMNLVDDTVLFQYQRLDMPDRYKSIGYRGPWFARGGQAFVHMPSKDGSQETFPAGDVARWAERLPSILEVSSSSLRLL